MAAARVCSFTTRGGAGPILVRFTLRSKPSPLGSQSSAPPPSASPPSTAPPPLFAPSPAPPLLSLSTLSLSLSSLPAASLWLFPLASPFSSPRPAPTSRFGGGTRARSARISARYVVAWSRHCRAAAASSPLGRWNRCTIAVCSAMRKRTRVSSAAAAAAAVSDTLSPSRTSQSPPPPPSSLPSRSRSHVSAARRPARATSRRSGSPTAANPMSKPEVARIKSSSS
mmetsp:Transcript_27981/g.70333  ORF Transcript_27981/g.70333 Transcript_27981/m.70333 type:complete len:226 (-) Transcript_27981:624-1301(-)